MPPEAVQVDAPTTPAPDAAPDAPVDTSPVGSPADSPPTSDEATADTGAQELPQSERDIADVLLNDKVERFENLGFALEQAGKDRFKGIDPSFVDGLSDEAAQAFYNVRKMASNKAREAAEARRQAEEKAEAVERERVALERERAELYKVFENPELKALIEQATGAEVSDLFSVEGVEARATKSAAEFLQKAIEGITKSAQERQQQFVLDQRRQELRDFHKEHPDFLSDELLPEIQELKEMGMDPIRAYHYVKAARQQAAAAAAAQQEEERTERARAAMAPPTRKPPTVPRPPANASTEQLLQYFDDHPEALEHYADRHRRGYGGS